MQLKIHSLTIASVILAMFITSCNKDDASIELTTIAEIQNSSDKVNIDPADLPANAQSYIYEFYFETYVETAAFVAGKGYEVMLANEDYLYFRQDGTEIRDLRHHDRPLHPGPCGKGRPVDINDLPQDILDYISVNYPGVDVLRAKRLPDYYLVLVSGRLILVFSPSGEFIREAHLFYHCRHHDQIFLIDELPAVIVEYINTHCPECEIVRAALIRGHIVVGVIANGSRKIFVFTREGEFLFMRG